METFKGSPFKEKLCLFWQHTTQRLDDTWLGSFLGPYNLVAVCKLIRFFSFSSIPFRNGPKQWLYQPDALCLFRNKELSLPKPIKPTFFCIISLCDEMITK